MREQICEFVLLKLTVSIQDVDESRKWYSGNLHTAHCTKSYTPALLVYQKSRRKAKNLKSKISAAECGIASISSNYSSLVLNSISSQIFHSIILVKVVYIWFVNQRTL